MKKIIFFMLLVLAVNLASAQLLNGRGERDNGYMWFAGGGGGLSFGTVTNINLRPSGGYKIAPNLHAGVSFYYDYYLDRRYANPLSFQTYGAAAFGRYFFHEKFFFQAEYERLIFNDKNYSSQFSNIYLDKANVGAGLRQWMSERSYTLITVLWNTFDNEFLFGYNPFIRIEFIFEF
jgi:hypothetical protein